MDRTPKQLRARLVFYGGLIESATRRMDNATTGVGLREIENELKLYQKQYMETERELDTHYNHGEPWFNGEDNFL